MITHEAAFGLSEATIRLSYSFSLRTDLPGLSTR